MHDLTILRATARTVTVPATGRTVVPGAWGIFLAGGGHLRVAGTPDISGGAATWQVEAGPAREALGRRAAWTGIVHPGPAAAGLTSTDHLFQSPEGVAPAWVIDGAPGERRPVWAVHVHGVGSSRAGTLRGVVSASAAGLPSAVVTYRNSEEGPHVGSGRSMLGWDEAHDVAAALDALASDAGTRFVLFGWSMGAQIALRLAASARWREQVAALVLDSPALSWPHVLEANAHHAGLPAFAGRQGAAWLSGCARARFTGLTRRIPLEEMDWVAKAPTVRQPVLVHHGRGDWSTPMTDAERFARDAPNTALRRNDGGHTTGWNIDPEGWHDSTREFLTRTLR
ncbi:S9 family peptidase [Microbacterium sp. 77mftsu3.1]|uniref:alpha/beta hydrolase family protein n=1 Tax=Microbacterium sp. 77mftsu3.1 TaxID=1761802 RepID=UPI0015A2A4DF|nr:alpha/beta hydrolase [Microbacterium sp. 77mftsu3.1]